MDTHKELPKEFRKVSATHRSIHWGGFHYKHESFQAGETVVVEEIPQKDSVKAFVLKGVPAIAVVGAKHGRYKHCLTWEIDRTVIAVKASTLRKTRTPSNA